MRTSAAPLVLLHDDKELIMFLGERRLGDPIPPNVITVVNPFSIEPWDFPGVMWFLYNSDGPQSCSKESIIQVTRNGYWKSVDDLRIFASTFAVGRKTIREFYIGQVPFGDRTGWMMHEYTAEKMVVRGMGEAQDTNSLCRLFLHLNAEQRYPRIPEQCIPFSLEQCRPGSSEQCDPWNPEHCVLVSQQLSDPMDLESTLLRILEEEEGEEINSSRKAASNYQIVSEVEKSRPESPVGPSQDLVPPQDLVNGNFMGDMQAICDFSKGGFPELKDLYDPESSPTSSDSFSLTSMDSDDYFDADTLLRDIENESRLNRELKDLYNPESSPMSSDSFSLKSTDSYFDAEALLRDMENESRLNQELKDLYNPESSPTFSDCFSITPMDSDDYFDAEALLRDIENESRLNLELKDLYNPESSPTSSDSFSLTSMDSYFDAEALLRDMENESRLNQELKDLYNPESSPTFSDCFSITPMDSDDYFDAEALLRDRENESRQRFEIVI